MRPTDWAARAARLYSEAEALDKRAASLREGRLLASAEALQARADRTRADADYCQDRADARRVS